MKHLFFLFLLVCSGFIAGCDDDKPRTTRTTVDYELARKLDWNAAEKKLKGSIRIKTRSVSKEMPLLSNTYGIAFELTPGDRTTIIVMNDDEGTYFTGEYPDLPIQLPRLLSLQRPAVSMELLDPEMCAAGEVALSEEPIDGKYYLLFNNYDLKSAWLYGTSLELPAGQPLSDSGYVSLAKGKEVVLRTR